MSRKHKNIEFSGVEVLEMSSDGRCVAKHEELVIFIEHTAPGDIVDIRLTKKKSNYAEATVTNYVKLSPNRIKPECEHFGLCGGCKWQHVSYEQQLQFKEKDVQETLRRLGRIPLPTFEPILGSAKSFFYRNKLDFTFSNRRWLTVEEINSDVEMDRNALGFHIPGRFDKILDVKKCHLQEEPSNTIRLAVNEFTKAHDIPFFDLNSQEGMMRNLIIRSASTGDLMVIVQFAAQNDEWIKLVMDFLKEKFPEITSLLYIVNTKRNETFHDQEVICYNGQPFIEEEMEGLKFRVGPKSFYQTNSEQAYRLYCIAREFADIKPHEIVYDLYTGTGTIANFVARTAKKVVGVEYVPTAIEDAKVNSKINGINNTVFYAGDMKAVLTPDFAQINDQPDVIITDPPRAGMDKEVIERMLEMAPDRIVYVSCNAATQARDLTLLHEKYDVVRAKAVDMFPQTHHCESVVLLKKRA